MEAASHVAIPAATAKVVRLLIFSPTPLKLNGFNPGTLWLAHTSRKSTHIGETPNI